MNLEKYNECFIKVLDVKKEDLNNEFTFESTDSWDSLAHLNLIGELEDEFGIQFESEDIIHFGGYENGKRILAKYGVSME